MLLIVSYGSPQLDDVGPWWRAFRRSPEAARHQLQVGTVHLAASVASITPFVHL